MINNLKKYDILPNTISGGTLYIGEACVPGIDVEKPRKIRIFLPFNYNEIDRFPVVYMMDGKNLFDKYTSFAGEWEVDEVLEKRIKDINSGCEVIKIDKFIDNDNFLELFNYNIDYFVDACDTMTVKKMVITECIKRKIKFISSMGTGNKLDPSKLEIVDIRKTINDPLAKVIRKFVKDEKINSKVMVLSSSELPVKTGERTPGSTAFVPASAGLLIASYVVRQFISK